MLLKFRGLIAKNKRSVTEKTESSLIPSDRDTEVTLLLFFIDNSTAFMV